jgi:hypothetical protein
LALRSRPLIIAPFAPLQRTPAIQRDAKRDAHEPPTKPAALPQAIETAIRAQQRFLSNIFRIRAVPQNPVGDAVRQRATFREAGLKVAPRIGLRRLARRLFLCPAAWLDQNQLLHSFSCAGNPHPLSPYNYLTPWVAIWFNVQ